MMPMDSRLLIAQKGGPGGNTLARCRCTVREVREDADTLKP